VIVDLAKAMNSRAIVMPARQRPGGAPLSRTLDTVLAERPCRVIVQSIPEGDQRKAAGGKVR
ncbi:MAG: hypothetical protein NTX07_00475, partial [Solirubrobacterales bacterium]|nr:hypothetical protein [Solirubrobacterales bacterium]